MGEFMENAVHVVQSGSPKENLHKVSEAIDILTKVVPGILAPLTEALDGQSGLSAKRLALAYGEYLDLEFHGRKYRLVCDVVCAARQDKMRGPDYTDYFLKVTIEKRLNSNKEEKDLWKPLDHRFMDTEGVLFVSDASGNLKSEVPEDWLEGGRLKKDIDAFVINRIATLVFKTIHDAERSRRAVVHDEV
jgi:hypothetical protein